MCVWLGALPKTSTYCSLPHHPPGSLYCMLTRKRFIARAKKIRQQYAYEEYTPARLAELHQVLPAYVRRVLTGKLLYTRHDELQSLIDAKRKRERKRRAPDGTYRPIGETIYVPRHDLPLP